MPPTGLVHVPDLVSPERERRARDAIEAIDFRPVVMREQEAAA